MLAEFSRQKRREAQDVRLEEPESEWVKRWLVFMLNPDLEVEKGYQFQHLYN